jgi:hypothetical protein
MDSGARVATARWRIDLSYSCAAGDAMFYNGRATPRFGLVIEISKTHTTYRVFD